MKKIFILLSVILCACGNNDNPQCITNAKEVQIIGIAKSPYDAPVAVAKICTPNDNDVCTGDWVLIPKGLVSEMKHNKKITPPKHHCFVFADYYEDVDENDVARKTPILGFAYNKKHITKKDWNDFIYDMTNQEYIECLKHAEQEFKDSKLSDNEKTCKCVIDYIYSDENPNSENADIDIPDRFATNLRVVLKNKCGNNIPEYTLRDISEK